MMISNWNKPFGFQGLYKNNSALQFRVDVSVKWSNFWMQFNEIVLTFGLLQENNLYIFFKENSAIFDRNISE